MCRDQKADQWLPGNGQGEVGRRDYKETQETFRDDGYAYYRDHVMAGVCESTQTHTHTHNCKLQICTVYGMSSTP